jgi:hypothetical protein
MYITVYVYHRVCISRMYITLCMCIPYVYHLRVLYSQSQFINIMYIPVFMYGIVLIVSIKKCIHVLPMYNAPLPKAQLTHSCITQLNNTTTQGCMLVLRWEAAEEESVSVFLVPSLPP